MVGPKNTQTRFVGIITSTIHPYACFLSRFNYMDIKLTSNPTVIMIKNNRIFFHIATMSKLFESRRPKNIIIIIIDINHKLVACTHYNREMQA